METALEQIVRMIEVKGGTLNLRHDLNGSWRAQVSLEGQNGPRIVTASHENVDVVINSIAQEVMA
ncbi:MAG: hypothetical protein AB7L09_22125 [Nitrospira sp.]